MALGAMAKDPNANICIIACGLKYFKPHKFRSQVIVEFSTPYRITPELIAKYKKSKRDACGEMLVEVEKKMREVTLNAPSYKELKQIYMARSIYMPTKKIEQDEDGVTTKKKANYTIEEINFIQKNFCKGFNAYRSKPELKDLLEDIDQYMKELKNYNIHDNQVQNFKINFMRILGNFLITIPKVAINLLFVSIEYMLIQYRAWLDSQC